MRQLLIYTFWGFAKCKICTFVVIGQNGGKVIFYVTHRRLKKNKCPT